MGGNGHSGGENKIDSVLSFALSIIENNHHFFKSWAEKTGNPALKKALLRLAKEELEHKTVILTAQHERELDEVVEKVVDLKLGDYFKDIPPSEEMSYQEALQIAMKREIAAMETYRHMAEICTLPKMKEIFLALADDAGRHKNEFEKEYADKYMSEN